MPVNAHNLQESPQAIDLSVQGNRTGSKYSHSVLKISSIIRATTLVPKIMVVEANRGKEATWQRLIEPCRLKCK